MGRPRISHAHSRDARGDTGPRTRGAEASSHPQPPHGRPGLLLATSAAQTASALPDAAWPGIRHQGSQTGPGGPMRGCRNESVVTAGVGKGGPGPSPAETFAAGWGSPGEAGGGGLAAPGARGAWGWGVTAEAYKLGSGPGEAVGTVLGPGGAVSADEAVLGLTAKVWGDWAARRLPLTSAADQGPAASSGVGQDGPGGTSVAGMGLEVPAGGSGTGLREQKRAGGVDGA